MGHPLFDVQKRKEEYSGSLKKKVYVLPTLEQLMESISVLFLLVEAGQYFIIAKEDSTSNNKCEIAVYGLRLS